MAKVTVTDRAVERLLQTADEKELKKYYSERKRKLRYITKWAKDLGKKKNTEWAEENEHLYQFFYGQLEYFYNTQRITASEFNELASIAFYDFEPKEC